MLTQTLPGLERDGLLTRTVTPTVPVTVEYELTDLGRSLSEAVATIRAWHTPNMNAISDARTQYDAQPREPVSVLNHAATESERLAP